MVNYGLNRVELEEVSLQSESKSFHLENIANEATYITVQRLREQGSGESVSLAVIQVKEVAVIG